jgi:hypothetical protein
MSGVFSSGDGHTVLSNAGGVVTSLTDSVETQARQAAMLRAQEEENARFTADAPGRKQALGDYAPQFGFDQRRARTSLLGVG